MEHAEPAASVAGQLFACEKTVAPEIPMDEIVSIESPVLESVTTCGELAAPSRCIENVNDAGDNDAVGAIPVPESAPV